MQPGCVAEGVCGRLGDMDRRDFLSMSAAAAAAGFFIDSVTAMEQPAKGAAAPAIDSPPVLQNPATDAMTVMIAVNAITTAWVEFGETVKLGRRADNGRHGLLPLNGRIHGVRMTGLKPGTQYFYRVGVAPINFGGPYKISRGAAVFTEVFSFRTLASGDVASFCVINDTHENIATLGGVADLVMKAKADLTFWNGDVFNDVRSDEQIVTNVLRPAGRAYAAQAPLCFVSGNHDVRGIHARSLENFVETPGGVRHYVVRQGPVAFIVLDTGEDKADGHKVYAGLNAFERYRDMQRVWLEQAIQREEVTSAALRVVVQHIPMWGGGSSEDSRRKWAGVLKDAKVHAMICGHTHKHFYSPVDAERAYPQLVGGGPAVEAATVIEGRADGSRLSLIARDLTGKEIGNFEIKA